MNASFGRYDGEDGGGGVLPIIAQLVPGVSALLEKIADPAREYELLKVKLHNAKISGASLSTIRELEAKVASAKRRYEVQVSREKSSTQWSNIGKVAAVGGILVVAAIGLLVVVKTIKVAKATKRKSS